MFLSVISSKRHIFMLVIVTSIIIHSSQQARLFGPKQHGNWKILSQAESLRALYQYSWLHHPSHQLQSHLSHFAISMKAITVGITMDSNFYFRQFTEEGLLLRSYDSLLMHYLVTEIHISHPVPTPPVSWYIAYSSSYI